MDSAVEKRGKVSRSSQFLSNGSKRFDRLCLNPLSAD